MTLAFSFLISFEKFNNSDKYDLDFSSQVKIDFTKSYKPIKKISQDSGENLDCWFIKQVHGLQSLKGMSLGHRKKHLKSTTFSHGIARHIYVRECGIEIRLKTPFSLWPLIFFLRVTHV